MAVQLCSQGNPAERQPPMRPRCFCESIGPSKPWRMFQADWKPASVAARAAATERTPLRQRKSTSRSGGTERGQLLQELLVADLLPPDCPFHVQGAGHPAHPVEFFGGADVDQDRLAGLDALPGLTGRDIPRITQGNGGGFAGGGFGGDGGRAATPGGGPATPTAW